MNRTRTNPEAVEAGKSKAPYVTPRLKQLGEVAELTGAVTGSVSDSMGAGQRKGV